MGKIEVTGFKTYRHEQNPKEQAFHDGFISQNTVRDMDYIVFGHTKASNREGADDYLNEREQRIVLSTIQWLGSPVGQGFLREMGYCETCEFETKEHHWSSKLASLEEKLAKIPIWIKSIFI